MSYFLSVNCAQAKMQTDMAKMQLDAQKAQMDDDRKRDQMDQDMIIKGAELLAKTGTTIDTNEIKRLQAGLRKPGGEQVQ